jgi:sugar transferase (PEP-CTERM/EpsH1 system associated)
MNICFVTSRFPFPISKGDTLRAYYQIRELSRNHSVHLIAVAETAVSDAALREMKKYCTGIDIVRVGRVRSFATVAALGIASKLPLQVLYFLAPELRSQVVRAARQQKFDVIHAMTIRVAPAAFAVPGVPVVVDFMDSFGANISTRRALVGPLKRRVYDMELARVTAYERDVARRAAGGLVIAELDRSAIGRPELAIVPNGVDFDAFRFHDGERDPATLIFTGNMGYQPNVDAVTWFAAEIWPALKAARPELRFQIVGARPTPAVAALGRIAGIEVTGRVESMVPFLHRATIAVCPIRCGSGMQNKLLEAMATGAPVATTDFANRGIGATAGRELSVAAEGGQFVEAVLRLLADPALRARQAHAAKIWVEATYGWSRHATALVDEYRRAIETASPAAFKRAG